VQFPKPSWSASLSIGLKSNIRRAGGLIDADSSIERNKSYQGEFVATVKRTMVSAKSRYLNFALVALVLLSVATKAAAESAKEQLRDTIDRVIEVLRTIRSPEDIDRNRNSLRQLLLSRFDFAAMAQNSLGNRWNELNGKEKDFVSAFTDFVEHSYMSTLGSYRGEKVVYDRDRVDGQSAEVDTRVVGGEGTPIKIGYKLHIQRGQWMVYDAVIDDVSVVGNYRSQFMRILKTASLEELIQSLRAKTSGR
jgi:phospholipid transport system substrate-binding protein